MSVEFVGRSTALPDPRCNGVVSESDRSAEPLTITFLWALPYRVPVHHLTTIPVVLDGDLGPSWDFIASVPSLVGEHLSTSLRIPRVSIRLWQRKSETPYGSTLMPALEVMAVLRGGGSAPEYSPPAMDDYVTVVEAVTQLPSGADIDVNLSHAFNASLEAVNRVTRAYALSTSDPDAFPLRREILEPMCLYFLRSITGDDRGAGTLVLNNRLPSELPMLDDSAMERLVEFLKLLTVRNPLLPAMDFSLERNRAFAAGDYSVAVVMAATALEISLNVLLRLLLAEEGKTTSEIDELFASTPGLKTRIEAEYAPRLGGSWTVEREGLAR